MKSALILAAALAVAGVGQAQPAGQGRPAANQCFYINQFESWRALDDKTVYIRVNLHDVYRLDLSASCPAITDIGVHLITKSRGTESICSALDWDLAVADSGPGAIPTHCIVSSMRKLSPAEAAAIPKRFQP